MYKSKDGVKLYNIAGATLLFSPTTSLLLLKVVDSCWISSTEWSDTFRSFLVYGKKQESRKKNIL